MFLYMLPVVFKFILKTWKLEIFLSKAVQYDTIKHFTAFGCVL